MHKFLVKKSLPNYLFIVLFFIVCVVVIYTFYLVNNYEQNSLVDVSEKRVTANVVKELDPTPFFANGSFDQCGEYDFEKVGMQAHGVYQTNPAWSKDCRFIAWSADLKGRGYYTEDPQELAQIEKQIATSRLEEGIYVYSDRVEKREKVAVPSNFENPQFEVWYDRMRFVISYLEKGESDRANRKKVLYDVYEKKILFDYPL